MREFEFGRVYIGEASDQSTIETVLSVGRARGDRTPVRFEIVTIRHDTAPRDIAETSMSVQTFGHGTVAHSQSPHGSFLIRLPDGMRTKKSSGMHIKLAIASQPKSPL